MRSKDVDSSQKVQRALCGAGINPVCQQVTVNERKAGGASSSTVSPDLGSLGPSKVHPMHAGGPDPEADGEPLVSFSEGI